MQQNETRQTQKIHEFTIKNCMWTCINIQKRLGNIFSQGKYLIKSAQNERVYSLEPKVKNNLVKPLENEKVGKFYVLKVSNESITLKSRKRIRVKLLSSALDASQSKE